MKQLSKFLIYVVVIGVFGYVFQDPIKGRLEIILNNIQSVYAPCDEPITYELVAFDSRFGISRGDFLSALKEAEDIWEKQIGLDLFSNAVDGNVKVSLIYDYRQEATANLKSLGLVVDENRSNYDELNQKYTELVDLYNKAKANYDVRLAAFDERRDAYDKQVVYWNSKGGAPKNEYEKLQAEAKIIDAEIEEIKILQGVVNGYVANIKSIVVVLNNIANALNIDVRKYNEIGDTRGEEFEEGVYRNDGQGNEEIDIYEFSSHTKLVRVLAHELGHALGLPHVEDKNAIMYKLNMSKNQTLTQADIDAVKIKCKIK
ncbi:MAG: matrixin family metalloprotease [Candidatus Paceibacterota bacterium]|jgi:hypothetical protein